MEDKNPHIFIIEKPRLYKCRKCGGISQAVGAMFSFNIIGGIERDLKFCVYCMIEMFQKYCGEVDEVTDEKET